MLVTGTPQVQVDFDIGLLPLLQASSAMPLGYFVPANGRTGAELRVARRLHELVATGPSARLGSLLPHNTITTTLGTDGRPIEVRLSFVLALWLVLGCPVPNDAVAALFVYMHIVGAERLGAALDVLLADFDIDDAALALTPSVLRRKLLERAVHARARALGRSPSLLHAFWRSGAMLMIKSAPRILLNPFMCLSSPLRAQAWCQHGTCYQL